ncbi:MAG TPA: HepT-like ribonuclease domain-containing protein [Gemmatimonadaceae bacterium]
MTPDAAALLASLETIDIAGDLSARRGDRFADYTEAVRNLGRDGRFPADLVRELERLPGFRKVLVHEYVALDMNRVVEALDRLEPIERFLGIVRDQIAG